MRSGYAEIYGPLIRRCYIGGRSKRAPLRGEIRRARRKPISVALWDIKRGGDYEFTGAYVGGDDYSCRAGD